ncbi:NAD(P)H-dependent oxidoreductase [Pseudoprimorskyibacter insulae]|uniref:NAD(P)H nitroreductase YfkO n=1 Tax=Pseudoprimorskyibacter insulae TaxID=1695997 RepID=A0A2R8AYH3_9RHOB|nr:NAD(P)H-dependent oxidoreductase [Pseudoprimorskyibacter insulae]SPF81076.1 Putative NAD(P)H nitroreductase YfkO [Pseudoprimorskyibacter insulae]
MFYEKLEWRYATKAMDANRVVPSEKIERIIEAARKAPTSSGLQPFEMVLVTNPEVRAELSEAAFGQQQLVDGTAVLVFAAWDNYTDARIDDFVNLTGEVRGGVTEALTAYYDRLKGMYLPRDARTNFEHAARQAYIALGFALMAAAEEGVDATPMEGLDPAKFDEILGLGAKGLKTVVILTIGYRDEAKDWLAPLPKVRKSRDQIVTDVK